MKLFGLRFAAILWAIAMFNTGCIGSMIEKRKAERIENDAAYRHSLGIYRVGDIYDADGKRGVVFEIDSRQDRNALRNEMPLGCAYEDRVAGVFRYGNRCRQRIGRDV